MIIANVIYLGVLTKNHPKSLASVLPNWDTGGPKKQDTGPKNRFTGGSKPGPPETAGGGTKKS